MMTISELSELLERQRKLDRASDLALAMAVSLTAEFAKMIAKKAEEEDADDLRSQG